MKLLTTVWIMLSNYVLPTKAPYHHTERNMHRLVDERLVLVNVNINGVLLLVAERANVSLVSLSTNTCLLPESCTDAVHVCGLINADDKTAAPQNQEAPQPCI